ncbi:MAG TPA: response regulator, partial [Pyrinomonadaceae bacterium]|nr:response regulator [Pyrinomonadaceae bacterium]
MNINQNKILIVDDDSSIRFALTEALRSWNYESVSAQSLAEARQVFETEEPKVVLLDIDLPDGSGIDFLSEIKQE